MDTVFQDELKKDMSSKREIVIQLVMAMRWGAPPPISRGVGGGMIVFLMASIMTIETKVNS